MGFLFFRGFSGDLRAAPLHHGEAGALRGGQVLGGEFHRGVQGFPGHEHPQEGVRLRGDGQHGVVRVGGPLEGDQVVGVRFHPGQPVDDELVGLPAGEAQLGQGVLQEGGGVGPGDAESLREVIGDAGRALPVEVVVGLAGPVRQRPVGGGGDGPGAVLHGGVNAGQLPIVVQRDGDLQLGLWVEVDDRFLLSPAAGEQTQGQDCQDDPYETVFHETASFL